MIKIDKNVPIPKRGHLGRPRKYPFREMEVGDSFLGSKALASNAGAYRKQNPEKSFTVREVEGGYRVWRTE